MIMIAKNMQIRRYNHTRISKKKMLFIVTSPTPLFIADIASLQAMHTYAYVSVNDKTLRNTTLYYTDHQKLHNLNWFLNISVPWQPFVSLLLLACK